MRGIEKLRASIRAEAARNLGVPHHVERVWAKQVAVIGREAELARLPVETGDVMMDGSGVPLFMFGLSLFIPSGLGDPSKQDPFR